MDILIIYDSKTGTTKKCVDMILKGINGQADVVNIGENKLSNDLNKYKKVIIGSYVNIGRISSKINKFCRDNIKTLLEKQVYIFLCTGISSNYKKYLKENFDEKLLSNAIFSESLGGEYNTSDLKGFKKFMIELIIKNNRKNGIDDPKIIEENVTRIINVINNF